MLVGFLGDPRVIAYFFEGVRGSGWLVALAEHDLLNPRRTTFGWRGRTSWCLRGLTARCERGLQKMSSRGELDERQELRCSVIARLVWCGVSGVGCGSPIPTYDQPVVHHVAAYLDDMPRDEHGSPNVLELLKRALTA